MEYSNIIKTDQEYKTLKDATQVSVTILKQLISTTKEGVSAGEINELAGKLCKENSVLPAFKGVPGPKMDFDYNVCISVNDGILHGIPHSEIVFKPGDVVKIDFGVIHNSFYTDHCYTLMIAPDKVEENPNKQRELKLIQTAKLCIDTAVKAAIVGNNVLDISGTMQEIAELAGFKYVKNYCGHGIGRSLWLEPEVPSYRWKNRENPELLEGMVLCIENQLTIGSSDLYLDEDGWTLRTEDGSKGAMFEHMVIVREGKPEILTLLD